MKGQTAAGKVRKSTKGVPRVTDKVLAMDEAGRKAWLAERTGNLSVEQKAEIEKRIADGLAGGRTPKKVNFATLFNGRSVAELSEAQAALTGALAGAAVAEEESLNRIIAKATQQKALLVAARQSKAAGVKA